MPSFYYLLYKYLSNLYKIVTLHTVIEKEIIIRLNERTVVIRERLKIL
ncbi:hypothetical protein DNHGIG_35180 [Collibacillus ludicampi]|uniref:Uncharacterized protein n=1 Tax=Collibacillus ludicampi TaxID=2771369 RepID=A0AAV4LJG8_9BACL|nr:hypothetical protein DNHGIG_35180 [Collibacillus ludicampi]